ncbi:3-keto-disaccharide hydrolase [Aquipuribacter sp. SD81]|uniref:3-keto-disaccharide hydrolase n=1 Tax=Aquipuribacter sp. SD81 TaxID=3127703 RepID=UPI00301A7145
MTRSHLAVGVALVLGAGALTASAPASAATCDAPDSRPTVRFLDTASRVANADAGGGCTINDLIDDESSWGGHGAFVRHVRDVVDDLVADGVVDRREAGALRSAAARSDVGRVAGYEVLFDGTAESLEGWDYAGDGGFELVDGLLRSQPGGFGTLWYAEEEYGDFSLRLQFRDDAPGGPDVRANSGVQVRFPALDGPVEGCPTTFNGAETNNLSWIAVNCGHEVQVNDSPDGDPRKTGSIYGFADLTLEEANPTPKGVWNDLEIRVVDQHYTVIRNGVVINSYENVPGVPFPDRPDDPDSSSRGLVGHVGLQAHGSAPDVVSFRDVRIRELGCTR